MHKLYMHRGVALRGGRANRSAKLGWQKERARPARSYCQPMMHFIFIFQVDLVGNWLLYSISEERSSNLTIFLNLFDKFNGHTNSFRHSNYRNSTALSNYIWMLKDKKISYSVKWKIIDRGRAYKPSGKNCSLCDLEKFHIIFKPELASLNQRNELATSCRHRRKYLLCNN